MNNKYKKKVRFTLSFLLAAFLGFGMVSCGLSNNPTSNSTSQTPTSDKTTSNVTSIEEESSFVSSESSGEITSEENTTEEVSSEEESSELPPSFEESSDVTSEENGGGEEGQWTGKFGNAGYYLVGEMNAWNNFWKYEGFHNFEFVQDATNENVYTLNFSVTEELLAASTGETADAVDFRVMYWDGNQAPSEWWPDGVANNGTINAAGEYKLTFNKASTETAEKTDGSGTYTKYTTAERIGDVNPDTAFVQGEARQFDPTFGKVTYKVAVDLDLEIPTGKSIYIHTWGLQDKDNNDVSGYFEMSKLSEKDVEAGEQEIWGYTTAGEVYTDDGTGVGMNYGFCIIVDDAGKTEQNWDYKVFSSQSTDGNYYIHIDYENTEGICELLFEDKPYWTKGEISNPFSVEEAIEFMLSENYIKNKKITILGIVKNIEYDVEEKKYKFIFDTDSNSNWNLEVCDAESLDGLINIYPGHVVIVTGFANKIDESNFQLSSYLIEDKIYNPIISDVKLPLKYYFISENDNYVFVESNCFENYIGDEIKLTGVKLNVGDKFYIIDENVNFYGINYIQDEYKLLFYLENNNEFNTLVSGTYDFYWNFVTKELRVEGVDVPKTNPIIDGIQYKLILDDNVLVYTVEKCIEQNKNVVIQSEIDGIKVVSIQNEVFRKDNVLESIFIPNTIKTIGDSAFSEATNLEEVIFEEESQLEIIGETCFMYCHSLKSIEIPQNVRELDYYTFYQCFDLKYVLFEEGNQLEKIYECNFHECYSLKAIVLPNSVRHIEPSAFGYTNSFEKIYYLGNQNEFNAIEVHSDNNDSFFNATVYFYLETEPTLVGNYWYYDEVTGLPKIWGNDSNNDFDDNVSSEVSSEEFSSEISSDSDSFESIGGNNSSEIVSSEDSLSSDQPNSSNSSNLDDNPSSLITIFEDSFITIDDIEYVMFKNNETDEVGYMVYRCQPLRTKDVVIEEYINEIPVIAIGKEAFHSCVYVELIELPNTIKYIYIDAFESCEMLKKIILSSRLEYVEGAFSEVGELSEVYFNGTIEDWSFIVFGQYSSNPMNYWVNTKLFVTNDQNEYYEVTKIDLSNLQIEEINYNYQGMKNLEYIILPNTIQSIYKYAFSGCDNLVIYCTANENQMIEAGIGDIVVNSILNIHPKIYYLSECVHDNHSWTYDESNNIIDEMSVGEWELVKEPSSTEYGQEKAYCNICHEYIYRIIDMVEEPESSDEISSDASSEGFISSDISSSIESSNENVSSDTSSDLDSSLPIISDMYCI